jgi:hypothetical protein
VSRVLQLIQHIINIDVRKKTLFLVSLKTLYTKYVVLSDQESTTYSTFLLLTNSLHADSLDFQSIFCFKLRLFDRRRHVALLIAG